MNDIGRVEVATDKPVPMDPYTVVRDTGGFLLVDADLRPGFTKPLTRPVKFQGVLIRDGADYLGAGFFTLPERPEGSQTPGNTAILGGKVELLENEN